MNNWDLEFSYNNFYLWDLQEKMSVPSVEPKPPDVKLVGVRADCENEIPSWKSAGHLKNSKPT